MGLPKGTGTFLMELEFPAVVSSQISTEPEVRWWYFWTANKVERMGSTTVRYLIQWMSKIYIGVYTASTGEWHFVCTLLFCSTLLQCYMCCRKWESYCPSLHSQQAWLLCPFCTECPVCLKKVLRYQTVAYVFIMNSRALKDWFDYSQCYWQGRGGGELP